MKEAKKLKVARVAFPRSKSAHRGKKDACRATPPEDKKRPLLERTGPNLCSRPGSGHPQTGSQTCEEKQAAQKERDKPNRADKKQCDQNHRVKENSDRCWTAGKNAA